MEFYDKTRERILAKVENGMLEILETNEEFTGGETFQNTYLAHNEYISIIQKMQNSRNRIAFIFKKFEENKYAFKEQIYQFYDGGDIAKFVVQELLGHK